ncbi:MAG: NAD-binding protein [Anaerolineales bacterium]|jgi:trk system potassium uptake protein TrkA|nr:NAD-binding protein [Anaerolineales bacterium]
MMSIIVVGCGRVGAELSYRLFQNGHRIVVVDRFSAAFQNLPDDFNGRLVEGHAMNLDVLRRAGIEETDALAAVTSSDPVNTVIGHLAVSVFNVPSVAVRNYDSRFRSMYELFGLQMVSASSWGAQRVEELLYQQQTHTVFSAGNGEVELYEFAIDRAWDGSTFADLLPDKDCLPVALTRAGRAMLPERDTVLGEGDIVLVSATHIGSEKLRKKLDDKKPELKKRD